MIFLRAQGFKKYKSSEWLMKRIAINFSFRFFKRCLKCWNHRKGTKKTKSLFCTCFLILVFLEIVLTLLTLLCLNCLFHMNNHIYKVVYVMFVEIVSWWNVTSENICKTSTNFFLVPGWSSQHFKHLLKNPKL